MKTRKLERREIFVDARSRIFRSERRGAIRSHGAIIVTLILDPRTLILSRGSRKVSENTRAVDRLARALARAPSRMFRAGPGPRVRGRTGLNAVKISGPRRFGDRSVDRGIRRRTLRIARGKENVETARGTRHTIASRVAACDELHCVCVCICT